MRRTASGVASLALLTVMVVPAGAGAAAERPVGELHETRDRLAGAQRELSEVEAAVRRTSDEVSVLDHELLAAGAALAEVADELTTARRVAADAVESERRVTAELSRADQTLERALAGWRDGRDRLATRAVHAFKHGSATTPDLLMRGVAGANDFHDVAVTLETVGRLTETDRLLVADELAFTHRSAALRSEVAGLRATSRDAIRTSAAEAARVEQLVARQRRIVDEVSDAHARRATALAELEADAAARAVLVRDLERRVAALELDASRVLVPVEVDLDPFGPAPAWAAGLPGDGPRWSAAVAATAARHGLDGRLLAALVWTESNFQPGAVSHAGALGLAQLMPGTARGLGVDPADPLANLDGGARYLRSQLDRFGRVDLALAAYNAGPGRVERTGGVPNIVETQLYVVRVLERFERLGG